MDTNLITQNSRRWENKEVEVRPIDSKQDFKEFFEFPWKLYQTELKDTNWVPPLLSMRSDLLNKEKNPAWEYMRGQYFGAWIDGELVGTITAFVNDNHNEYWGENIGWFGTFETIDNQDVANSLIRQAEEWVKAQGCDAIRGPQSFTTHEEVGVLVDGFTKPVLMMPYNPPYYQRLLENAGYAKQIDVFSMLFDRTDVEKSNRIGAKLDRLAKYAMEKHNITIRSLDNKNQKEEFKIFKDIYNDAWDKNFGFVPMNNKELDALVESLGMFVEPELAFFAEIDGKPAAFALTLPDFNQLLTKVNPRPGVPEIVSLAQLGWHWKIARNVMDTLRCPLMGVREEFRNKGVDLALLNATYQNAPAKYKYVDFGWILETNSLVKSALSLGTEKYKTHRLYEKKFVRREELEIEL